jgi:hypothetical protein
MLAIATFVFGIMGAIARRPFVVLNSEAAIVLLVVMATILAVCGTALWRTTKFS